MDQIILDSKFEVLPNGEKVIVATIENKDSRPVKKTKAMLERDIRVLESSLKISKELLAKF